MRATLLKNVKKGEWFTLTDKVKYNEEGEVLSKYVRERGEYDRATKKYEVYKFNDLNDFRMMKGNRIVYVDFCF